MLTNLNNSILFCFKFVCLMKEINLSRLYICKIFCCSFNSCLFVTMTNIFTKRSFCRHKLSSLRVLGSVGEPINPEAWSWYYRLVGRENCSIVDTFWQTETGGHVLTTLPGATPMKPGAAVSLNILDWSP